MINMSIFVTYLGTRLDDRDIFFKSLFYVSEIASTLKQMSLALWSKITVFLKNRNN